nr:4-hydroxyproline 2-epimerase-like [Nerophis lumbriciformis]
MAERRKYLASRQDHLRRAVVCEPRGHEAVVGALLTPAVEDSSTAGVIFFNNAGTLGMCGHGLIGLVRSLQHRGQLTGTEVRLDTPVGTVSARLGKGGAIEFENVPASCTALDVEIEVEGLGLVRGDVAWGGNGFFLTQLPGEPLELANLDRLLDLSKKILRAARALELPEHRVLENHSTVDHVELFGPAAGNADSRNFVLCPGGEYDRSPCGTGTSAKLAVLHTRGELAIGQRWRQESITGGRFTGWLEERGEQLIPVIRGRAWITGQTTLHFADDDPLRGGFSPR